MKEIKTTTIYNENILKKFLEVHYFESMKTVRIILNILILVVIINFFAKEQVKTIDIITFIFVVLGILEVNTGIIPKVNYKRLLKKKDSVFNTKLTYTFKKNNFELINDKKEYIDYNTLKKVIEVEESYYLYINNTRALIVDKTNLEAKDIEILTNIFKEKVSTYKYIK